MKTVKYIKESNENFTYGEFYRVIDYWGDFGDYVIDIDDKQNYGTKTLKHFFEDRFYLYQSDLYEMTQISEDTIEIKTNHGSTITIKAQYPYHTGGHAYLEVNEKENE